MITYKLKINYQDTKVLQSNIELVSGDVGACRLECEFFDDGKRTDISNYIITLKARRADGVILSEGGKIENNKGIIKLDNGIYSVPGELYLEIALLDSAKNYITTKIIIVNVIEGLGETSETSENTSSAYVTLLNQVKSRIDEVNCILSESQELLTKTKETNISIKNQLDVVEAIAKGRATGYVFDSVADLDLWLQDENNVSKLVLGDNFYIREVDVPDYWWDGTERQQLETQKVDLSEYYTKTEVDDEYIKRISEYDAYIQSRAGEIAEEKVRGVRQDINELSHFRGYFITDAELCAVKATNNDFAYSAESGTKWICVEPQGWKNTGVPVPDQLTPASDTAPLMNGEAFIGYEFSYARGDHRHPTDTSRASVEDLNKKADKSEAVAFSNFSSWTVENNKEYFATNEINEITIAYPETDFLCSLYFTLASEGAITITLPESKYIGETPEFKNGETWELSIKNGVVVGGKVV